MKKLLLVSSLLAGSLVSSHAFKAPVPIPDTQFMGINTNAGLGVGETIYGGIVIINLENGEYILLEDSTGMVSYSISNGHVISDDGTIVFSASDMGSAAYYKNGEWHLLKVENEVYSNLAHAITPDGSRICGNIGTAPISLDEDNMMSVPCYWDIQADGTYGDYHLLPHPTRDWSGRVPQYAFANDISADGKTIVGQLVDNSGALVLPLVYTQKEDGEWEYSMPGIDQMLPAEINLPENPGEAPACPNPSNYLDEEAQAAYDAAKEAWEANGSDYSTQPNAADYLQGESKASYEADMAEYNAALEIWMPLNEAYFEAINEVLAETTSFQFNQAQVTPDGKIFVSDAISIVPDDDPMSWFPKEIMQPWLINLNDNNTIAKLSVENEESLSVNQVAGNTTYMLTTGAWSDPSVAYIYKDGEIKAMHDHLSELSPEHKSWVEDNLVKEIEAFDHDTFETYTEERTYTGLAYASEDLSKILLWHANAYDWESENITFGWYFDNSDTNGLSNAVVDRNIKVSIDADGNVITGEGIVSATVYDLSGRRVNGNINNGVYIVRAVTTDGAVIATKVVK